MLLTLGCVHLCENICPFSEPRTTFSWCFFFKFLNFDEDTTARTSTLFESLGDHSTCILKTCTRQKPAISIGLQIETHSKNALSSFSSSECNILPRIRFWFGY
uniref:Cystatin domain-containing protein n=1 Tax=Parascaris univalens TaxID=6257 RepID=A0A915B4F4_PARUN